VKSFVVPERDRDTTWIVTGDVGVEAAAHAPFLEDDVLDESALAVPLVLRPAMLDARPDSRSFVRARVSSPTSSVDLARTALEALGLEPPPQMRGESLWAVAQRGAQGLERARIATTTTRFSARWSGFVLAGLRDREGKLCSLSLEADCVSDVRATHPIAAEILHSLVFDELTTDPKRTTPPPPRPIPDAAGAASLRAWGVSSPSK
jgi:arylsulfatase A-like enzyme